jgi:hypothetical protein
MCFYLSCLFKLASEAVSKLRTDASFAAYFSWIIVFFPNLAHSQLQTPAASVNPLTQEITRLGMLSCASRVNQVSNFVGFGGNSGALVVTQPNIQEQRLFSIEMEVPFDKSHAYINSVFSPNSSGGCDASYQAIVFWPSGCEEVAAKNFATLKRANPLRTEILVLNGGQTTNVFLMRAGMGCISIKNEVVF